MQVSVMRRAYFHRIASHSGDDQSSWEAALDLYALGMARSLALPAAAPSVRVDRLAQPASAPPAGEGRPSPGTGKAP